MPLVLQPIILMDQGGSSMSVSENGVVGTLRAQTHGHEPIVLPKAYALQGAGATSQQANGSGFKEEECYTLNCTDIHGIALGFNTNARPDEMKFVADEASTLTRSQRAGVLQNTAVRRLTPIECERLQGFPDGYTDIKPNGKPTPDGPRYKALGNSWAVPCVRWIGQRIQDYTNKLDIKDEEVVL